MTGFPSKRRLAVAAVGLALVGCGEPEPSGTWTHAEAIEHLDGLLGDAAAAADVGTAPIEDAGAPFCDRSPDVDDYVFDPIEPVRAMTIVLPEDVDGEDVVRRVADAWDDEGHDVDREDPERAATEIGEFDVDVGWYPETRKLVFEGQAPCVAHPEADDPGGG